MVPDLEKLDELRKELKPFDATLVAVSKTKPVHDVEIVFNHGQLDFGENYVQELTEKQEKLPLEIRWHFIGHLQSNKVKFIAPFVHLIHGIDSSSLLKEVNKHAVKLNRKIDILLQIHIASESTKFGLDEKEAIQIMEMYANNPFPGVSIRGLMGMATFTEDQKQISGEFRFLKALFDKIFAGTDAHMKNEFNILSMGMTSDYKIALNEGSNMVRIGSAIFGDRDYNKS